MDWGIVVSVLVAMALFLVGLMVLGAAAGTLFFRMMLRKPGGEMKCPMPGCPFHNAMEKALHEAEEEREKVAA